MVSIIGCGKIFKERPKNLTAHAHPWSDYKHNDTAAYLIGITPSGAVIFCPQVRVEECQISRLVLIPVFSKRDLWAIVF